MSTSKSPRPTAKSPASARPSAKSPSKRGKSAATAAERKARIQELRRAERARERRNRVLTVAASVAVVVGLVGFGTYALMSYDDKQEKQDAAAAAPVKGEKTWDAEKLGRNHVDKAVDYPMTPAVGGDHAQAWANCQGNVYDKPVGEENAVHSLEHGAVWITYNDKAAAGDIERLSDKVSGTPYTLMSPVVEQRGAITLTAWGRQLSVTEASDPRVDQFLDKYVQGPQTPEPGAACTGGVGAA
ncbi:DUF3105 domain-containing protein [Streptomyces sp. LNU-CPARS28]|uniref:DUF3105 domain-containing protein n=1 Tax=Streptomyces sp. LNU-CPARS28 TaxID=3137371 RepID=UPI003137676A